MIHTRAALFSSPSARFKIRQIELESPGPDDVLLRMWAVGVCGSDLHVVRGEWTRPVPIVLGHEGAGIVEEVGTRVTSVIPGDRVIVHWAPACGTCGPCLRARPATCAELRTALAAGTLIDGTTRMSYEGAPVYRSTSVGGFAEQIVMPARSLIPLPGGFSMEEAALIGCAALTGVGAVTNVAHVGTRDRAVVIGAGGVGQFVVQALRIAGAEVIAVVDPSRNRRAAASRLGATHAVQPDELAALVAELGEGFDFAFDAVGGEATMHAALSATRVGGMTTLVGLPPAGAAVAFDPFAFIAQEKVIAGSMYGSGDPVETAAVVLAYAQTGKLNLRSLLGPSFALPDINEAIQVALAGEQGRVIVLPNGPVPA